MQEFTLETGQPVSENATIVPLQQVAERVSPTWRPALRYVDHVALLRAWRDLARRVNAAMVDVVIVHPCRYLQCPPALLWLQVPTVYFCHEVRRVDHDPSASGSRSPWTRPIYAPIYASERSWDMRATAAATVVVTNSTATARSIRSAYGRDAKPIRMGVPDEFTPSKAPLTLKHVLSVGSLIPGKGHDLSIRATGLADGDWPMVIVAPRPDPAEESRLRRIAESADVKLDVRIGISDRELCELYRSAVCTMYLAAAEPLGLVALEAQACGCPVIVSDEGGLPETLLVGQSGFAVERRPEAAAAMLSVLGSSLTRERFSRAASEHGAQFSWAASTDDLMASIEEAKRRRASAMNGQAAKPVLALISGSEEDSGAERYMRAIAVAARDREWRVIAGFPDRAATQALREDLLRSGAEVVPLDIGKGHGEGKLEVARAGLQEMARTVGWLRRVQPDTSLVVLSHPEVIPGALMAVEVARNAAVACVQLVPTGWQLTKGRRAFYWLISQLGLEWIAVSEDNRLRLESALGLNPNTIHRIYNGAPEAAGVPDERRTALRGKVRQDLGLPDEARIVLSVGRLNVQKAYDRIIESIPYVMDQRSDVWWVWAGEGPERELLESELGARGLYSNVRVLGHRADVPDLLTAADLLVLPSRSEGFPFVVLEAHAAETPVIVGEEGPLPEVVRHGVDGLVVDVADPVYFAEAQCWMLEHPEKSAAFARSAHKRTRETFSMTTMSDSTLDLLLRARGGSGRGSLQFPPIRR